MAEAATEATGRLHLRDVTKSFGGRRVVDITDLHLGVHAIEGIIGPNGAGKTTLMNVITQARRPDSGSIVYRAERGEGIDLARVPAETLVAMGRRWPLRSAPATPDEIARLGIVKSNQVITEFDSLTIRDSMLLAAARADDERFWMFGAEQDLRRERRDELAFYLDYFEIAEPDGAALSAGEKKLLDIIRCLLLEPSFLLLDEPTAGLPEDQTHRVMDLVRRKAAEEDVSIVIIEHDLALIWEACEFIHFMADGEILEQGPPEQLRASAQVAAKYLGTGG